MKKKQVQRLVAFSLATMMTLQGLSVNASGQVQVRTDSNTQMSSDKKWCMSTHTTHQKEFMILMRTGSFI